MVGEQARQLYADAAMPEQIIEEDWLEAKAVIGLAAHRQGHDDICLTDEHGKTIADLHHIRQQMQKREGESNLSLADFVAPEDGPEDWLGAFCVTTGHGVEERARAFEANNDDYNSIMLKALADRLAESFAEHLHQGQNRVLGLRTRRDAEQRRLIETLSGHPPCSGLSRLSGPYRESHAI